MQKDDKIKSFLIYDANCNFCINIAYFLRDFVAIENLTILSNTSKRCLSLHKDIRKKEIERDVHLVVIQSDITFLHSGADAVARVLSLKKGLGFIWDFHFIFPLPIKALYFISKKARKYIF